MNTSHFQSSDSYPDKPLYDAEALHARIMLCEDSKSLADVERSITFAINANHIPMEQRDQLRANVERQRRTLLSKELDSIATAQSQVELNDVLALIRKQFAAKGLNATEQVVIDTAADKRGNELLAGTIVTVRENSAQ